MVTLTRFQLREPAVKVVHLLNYDGLVRIRQDIQGTYKVIPAIQKIYCHYRNRYRLQYGKEYLEEYPQGAGTVNQGRFIKLFRIGSKAVIQENAEGSIKAVNIRITPRRYCRPQKPCNLYNGYHADRKHQPQGKEYIYCPVYLGSVPGDHICTG